MEGEGGGGLLMLCQYCSTLVPMEGIEIEIERERGRSQNPKGRKSLPVVSSESLFHGKLGGCMRMTRKAEREIESLKEEGEEEKWVSCDGNCFKHFPPVYIFLSVEVIFLSLEKPHYPY